jgi:hypothetical protein
MTDTRPDRRRRMQPLPGYLLHVLHLIPADGVWIDDDDLTAQALTGHRVPLDEDGRILKVRQLCRHGFVVMDRSGDRPRWTRTPKGSHALAARLRRPMPGRSAS